MRHLLICVVLALVATSCVTKSGARREAQKTLFESQQREAMEQQQREPAVWFRGDIRHPRVPWREDLTLVEALDSAHYTRDQNPHVLTVTRKGEVFKVDVRRLLRGQDNPVLEPNDIIDVRH